MEQIDFHAYDAPCLIYDGGTAWDQGPFACPDLNPQPGYAGPPNPNRPAYTLRFYTPTGILEGVITSNSGYSPLVSLEFDVTEKGPGRLSFQLGHLPFPIYHVQRLDIHLWNQQVPYWSGEIVRVPDPRRSDYTYKFLGMGWVSYLYRYAYTWSYEAQSIHEVMSHLAETYGNTTPIRYSPAHIEKNSWSEYETPGLEYFKTPSEEVWKDIEQLSGGMTVGIDSLRRMFLRQHGREDIDSDHILVVGREINNWSPETDSSGVYNRVVVKSGSVDQNINSPTYKTNYLEVELEDEESQRLYGVRTKVVNAPNILHPVDAYRWAAVELEKWKSPKPNNPAQKVIFDGRRWEPGRWVRILSGPSRYEHKLVRVRYKLAGGHIECRLYLDSDDATLQAVQHELAATKAREELARQVSQKQFSL